MLSGSDLVEAPDRCAWRLLRRLYAWFGYTEEQMPPELDPVRGLSFPR